MIPFGNSAFSIYDSRINDRNQLKTYFCYTGDYVVQFKMPIAFIQCTSGFNILSVNTWFFRMR